MKRLLLIFGLALFCCSFLSCDLLQSDSDDDESGDPQGTTTFEWVDIPAGAYTYGDSAAASTIDTAYKIMKYEVTNAQYVAFLEEAIAAGEAFFFFLGDSVASTVQGTYEGDEMYSAGTVPLFDLHAYSQHPYEQRITYSGGAFVIVPGYENHPAVQVTWFGAYAFAKHYGLALPTEEEWEMAARGNTGYQYPWGNDDPWDEHGVINCGLVNYGDCRYDTAPVGGTSGVSPYGVCEMAGNVYEWCHSWIGAGSFDRVVRGGSWNVSSWEIQTFARGHRSPKRSYWDGGFRCVKRS
ncbi:MAG: SUMF1/EgtB/PvdO family nonheme iron enzyme [Candidatus Eisenbacteria bacterium]|nr:SUMF1/EgtB/PvdO family nonheme iron enzyme [Candidatus Eisenbacteria bacterium]